MKKREYKIAILKRSLDILWTTDKNLGSKRVANVCGAIDDAYLALKEQIVCSRHEHEKINQAANQLLDVISVGISPYTFVGDWLSSKGIEVTEYMGIARSQLSSVDKRLIKYRRAWVKDMIRTLENGGELKKTLPMDRP